MKKTYFATILAVMALSSMWANASAMPTLDLSGKWALTITGEDPALSSNLVFVPTNFANSHDQTLYSVQGSLNDITLWGAAFEDLNGEAYLAWYLVDGWKFLNGFTKVLSWSDMELSLGIDGEEGEVVKLTKVADLYEGN